MVELQALGEDLVTLPSERLKKTADLPDELRTAVLEAQRMQRQDEAKRRQMQYIGKLMRAIDAEPIRTAIAEARGDSAAETARLHRLERPRADLLADEGVLHGIAERHPGADLQHLRTLRRATLKEQEQQKPPRNYRALFQAPQVAGNRRCGRGVRGRIDARHRRGLTPVRVREGARRTPRQKNPKFGFTKTVPRARMRAAIGPWPQASGRTR